MSNIAKRARVIADRIRSYRLCDPIDEKVDEVATMILALVSEATNGAPAEPSHSRANVMRSTLFGIIEDGESCGESTLITYCDRALAKVGLAPAEVERVRATQEGVDIGRAQGWKEANVEIDRLVAARAGERASAAEAIEGQAAEAPDPRQIAVRISTDLRTLHAQLHLPENEHAATYLRPNMLAIVELTDRLTQFAAWRTSRG